MAIVGGIDDLGAHLFMLDPLGSVMEETCVSTGSGSPVAYGILEDGYNGRLSVKEGIPLVVRAIKSAMKRDVGSGDSFDVVVLTPKDGYRELSESEKKAIPAN
jgi:proteasome beta subunit